MTTKKEKERLNAIAELGCSLCFYQGIEGTPSHIHHIRRGGRRKDSPTIPLCPFHHTGGGGIHFLGRRRFEREYGVSEEALLEQTLRLLGEIE